MALARRALMALIPIQPMPQLACLGLLAPRAAGLWWLVLPRLTPSAPSALMALILIRWILLPAHLGLLAL